MSNNPEVRYNIVGDNSQFRRDVQVTQGISESAYSSIKLAGANAFIQIGKAVLEASAKVGELLGNVLQLGQEFESKFAMVRTIMDESQMSVGEMQKAITETSSLMAIDAGELSESVYNAISATGDTAGAVKLVADASKLATSGFTDTSSALSVLTTAINAYGMETADAQKISDSLIMTQNLGVLTMGELSGSMGKAIASASAYGVDLYNVESAYIGMTKSGINTAESTTYLASMLKEMGDAGTQVGKIITEKTGKSFGTLMNSGYSLADVLGIVYDSVNGDSEALMGLWSSAEAGKASNAIVQQGLETFNANLEAVTNSAGTTETAYKKMADTTAHKTALIRTNLKNLGIAIYDDLDSPVGEVVNHLSGYVEDLNKAYSAEGMKGLISEAGVIVGSMASEILKKAPDFISAGLNLLISITKGVIENIPDLIPGMVEALISAICDLISNGKEVLEIGVALLEGIVKGLFNAIPSILSGIGDIVKTLFGSVNEYAEASKGKIGEMEEAYATAMTNMDGYTKTMTDSIATATATKSQVDTWIKRLAALEKQTSLTNEEQAEWNTLVQKIKTAIPEISQYINDETGEIMGGTEALTLYTEAWYDNAKAQAYATVAQEFLEEQVRLEQELTSAKQTQGEVQAELNGVEMERKAIMDMANAALGTQISDMETLEEALRQSIDTTDESTAKYADWADKLADCSSKENEYRGILEESQGAVADLQSAYDEASKSVEYYYTKSSEAGVKSQEVSAAADRMANNMNASMTKIKDSSVTTSVETQTAFLNMQKGIVDAGGLIEGSAKEMAEKILSSFDDLPDDLEESGKNTLLGMIDGMELKLSDLGLQADASAKEIADGIRDYLGIHSPSTVTKEFGKYTAQGLVEGMKGQNNVVRTNARIMAKMVADGISGESSSVYNAGFNLATGIISGINGATSWVYGKISAWCNQVVAYIRAKFGIHSPSTVMRDEVGKNLAIAIPVAFEEEEPDTLRRVAKSIGKITHAVDASVELPGIHSLTTGLAAQTANTPAVFNINLTGNLECDGFNLATLVLKNIDDASSFVLTS